MGKRNRKEMTSFEGSTLHCRHSNHTNHTMPYHTMSYSCFMYIVYTHIATLLRAPCDHMEMFMTRAHPSKKGCEIRITCHTLSQHRDDVLYGSLVQYHVMRPNVCWSLYHTLPLSFFFSASRQDFTIVTVHRRAKELWPLKVK